MTSCGEINENRRNFTTTSYSFLFEALAAVYVSFVELVNISKAAVVLLEIRQLDIQLYF